MDKHPHIPHPRSAEGFNNTLAVFLTKMVGSMWCAYAFGALALVSLPAAIAGGLATTVTWLAQTFLQLVLLSVIMVGQNVLAKEDADHQADTYMAHSIDEVKELLKSDHLLSRPE